MRSYPQGVSVSTTTHNSKPWGLTVSSFTSISLDPPLVMISIAKGSKSHEVFTKSDNFAINMLATGQESIAEIFAGKVPPERRFEHVRYRYGKSGAPILTDCSAYLDCKNYRTYDGGDHSIILGEVIDGAVSGPFSPLVYFNRRYTTVAITYLETVFAPDPW
ncbi:MAG: flavin reductase family protein [Thaumarchaeota archaeon]|nr:flavin reductase family protein [Candidatus Calditenuaceae archaeon]MDW8186682.1 flavin reductase family protein [Nitrososphaerota archaeon]